ncbi:MAG: phosphonopyruvate decarboxylase [Candidatus Omnitrophica bacterium]|nr:phosphonopyruvate decarboxylase [Candidatus Omnitrophota bacterium]
MINPQDFVAALKKKGFYFFTGVPCSFFQSAINCVREDKELRYLSAVNEGSALALASGAELAGSPAVVMLQNSGLGNLINPLTSLNMIYQLPALIFISGRAYGVSDEPQHEVIGRTMGGILTAMGVGFSDLPQEVLDYEKALQSAKQWMAEKKQPYVFFVRKDTVGSFEAACDKGRYPLSRMEAIRIVAEALRGDEAVIATTGMPSRELFSAADRPLNFYMQGSMGHAPSIALGAALAASDKKVIVLDGDGALLMHMGILSTVGHYQPKNLFHIVLDNEAYETTGNQDSTSATVDFCQVAKACGYHEVFEAASGPELKSLLNVFFTREGPVFLRIRINRVTEAKSARITTKYNCAQITDNFKKALRGG